jgi:DNA-binding phage protein
MTIKTEGFDAADDLETDEDMVAYLSEVFSQGDPAMIAKAFKRCRRKVIPRYRP